MKKKPLGKGSKHFKMEKNPKKYFMKGKEHYVADHQRIDSAGVPEAARRRHLDDAAGRPRGLGNATGSRSNRPGSHSNV